MPSKIADAIKMLAVPINSVKLDKRNARAHSGDNLEAIKRSLQHYGQRKPIVANKRTGVVEAGNGMLMAAQALGWDEIAVSYVDDDDVTAKAYSIMDNRSGDLSEFAMPTLKDLLLELDDGAFDMALTGFDDKALEQLMTAFHVDGADTPHLNDGDRSPFQQMTFTLHDEQAEIVKAALLKARQNGGRESPLNENGNGNALAHICGAFNRG